MSGTAQGTNLPRWVVDHFQQALDAHDRLMKVTHLSCTGIRMHTARPKMLQALAKAAPRPTEEHERQMARAEEDAAFALKEESDGFPVLTGAVAMAQWGWLENFVKGFLALWFAKRPGAVKRAPVQRLKVRLGDYLQLTKADQALYLVELLEQDLSSTMKSGVNRFNSLLQAVGLDVQIDDDVSKCLFELQKVRNNLAHRNGVVDRALRTACPWMGLKLNQPLNIGMPRLNGYSNATGAFLLALLYRVGDEYGIDLRSADDHSVVGDDDPATVSVVSPASG